MARVGLTHARLIQAAGDLADDEGVDALTPSALARRVGVRTPSLYAHVAGAEALHRDLTLLALEEMAVAVGEAIEGRAGHDALAALADAYRRYAREHPGRYAASQRPVDDATALASAGPRHVALIGAVLRGYELPEAEHPHAIRFLGSTIHGFIQSEATGAFSHSQPAADVSWSRVVAAIDVALRAWPRES